MRTIGIILIAAGCLLGVYAYQMDTTVTTEGRNFGYGISIPSMTVNNLGLMEERRNKLMIAGVLIIVGAIFTVFGERSKSEEKSYETSSNRVISNEVKCPYCAEMIKSEAVICRFCGKDVPKAPLPDPQTIYNISFNDKNHTSCPLCYKMLSLDSKELDAKQFMCPYCQNLINFTIVSDSTIMEKYGITKNGDKFCYDIYRYDSLDDAINYAKLVQSRNSG